MPDLKQDAADEKAVRFPELKWDGEHACESLEILASYCRRFARGTIAWYENGRRRKKNGAQALRLSAIFATALAGLVPILADLTEKYDADWTIYPTWATVALGVAALFVGLDKFWGFTSAWVRFLNASLELEELLERFQFDWEHARLRLAGKPPEPGQVEAMLELCRIFLLEVRRIVRDETAVWAVEFQSVVQQLDAAARVNASHRNHTAGGGGARPEGTAADGVAPEDNATEPKP